MTHSLKDKIEVNNTVPLPSGHLFEFCSRDYWQSLDTDQLIGWIRVVSWHLEEPKYDSVFGIFPIIREVDIDLTNSGRVLADFKGKRFAEANLYEFLCWASQRLASLGSMPIMPIGHLFEFCSRDYWLSLDPGQLTKWVEGVSEYLNTRHNGWSLEDAICTTGIDFKGSGRLPHDFEEETFAETDLYEFLSWAGQRLVWLSKESNVFVKKEVV